MSKNKKRRLFEKTAPFSSNIHENTQVIQETISTEIDTSIVKSELLFILWILIFISVSFLTINFTNNNSNWINDLSNALLRILIRNY